MPLRSTTVLVAVAATAASRLLVGAGRLGVTPRLVATRASTLSATVSASPTRGGGEPAPTVPLPDGVLVVHKPLTWSSFSVVAKLRNTLLCAFKIFFGGDVCAHTA